MLHSKKFDLYALALLVLCLGYMFLAAALDSGCRELFPRFTAPAAAWTEEALSRPVTIGRWTAVAGALLCALLTARSGPRAGLAIGSVLAALGCMAMVAADGAHGEGIYGMYFLGQCLLPAATAFLRLAVTGLVMSWFVRLRGRVLGLAVLGSVLYAAIGGSAVADLAERLPGGRLAPLTAGAAAALGLLALGTCFLLRDAPEDTGLYPDGSGYAPDEPEADGPLSKRKLLLALICLGALAAAAAGWTGCLAPRLMARHGGGDALVLQAAPWLALGAILAIPVGYVFGWLGDWLGAMNAVRLLALGEMAAVALLWAFPKELGVREGICLALSAALLMGGAPVTLPCAMAQIFGRRQYFSAGQALFPALYLAAALTGPVGRLLGGGERARLYIALFALASFGLLVSLFLRGEKKR